MPRTAYTSAVPDGTRKLGRRKSPQLSSFLRGLKWRPSLAWFGALALLCAPLSAWSIPPNTPITNTATVSYTVAGAAYDDADSDTVVTGPDAGNSLPHGLTLSGGVVDENAVAVTVGVLVVEDLDPTDTHTFVVSDDGTLMTDRVQYSLPGRPLSHVVMPLVRRQLDRIFRYRARVIQEILQPTSA